MFVKPRLVQFLTSVSVAAMFIATPLAVKFDGAAGFALVATAAFAQEISDDFPGGPLDPPEDCDGVCGPPTDPVDPPTDPVDPPIDPVDPPTDPVDPPTDPVDPPTDPVDPPIDPVDPPIDPVEPPIDPVDPPIDECDQKDAPDECFEPEPVVSPSPSDDEDDVPSNLPLADTPAEGTPEQKGLAFVETMRCQTACTASVTGDGEVTITLTSTTTGGESVETKITQDGDQVGTRVVLGGAGGDKIIVTADERFESEKAARDEVVERVAGIPVTLTLNVSFPEDVSQDASADITDGISAALADALGIDELRIDIAALMADS